MANIVSNQLFELIKSLTKSEKRYFKLFSSRHTIGEENNYCLLFDFIEKMNEYDEEKIFEHFKGEAFLNKFSITKGRLYQNVLKSLDSFYAESSIDDEIYTMLHHAEILFKKGLYNSSEKILTSAEKIAEKHEKHILLLSIKEKQKKLLETSCYLNTDEDKILLKEKEENEIINHIINQNSIWTQKSILFNEINKNGNFRNESEKEKIKEIYTKIENIKVEGIKSTFLYQHTKSAYFFCLNEYKKAFALLENNNQLLEENKSIFKDEGNYNFSVLSNLVYVSTKIKEFEKAKFYMTKLKSFEENYTDQIDLKVKYFSSLTSLELSLMIETSNYTNAAEIIENIEKRLTDFGSKISEIRRVYIEFKIAVILLSMGKFHESLKWITKILNYSTIDKQQDIFSLSQFVHLIIHFELNNFDYLPYAISALKRYLKGRNKNYRFETLFIKIFSKIAKEHLNHFEIEEILVSMKSELLAMKEDENEKVVLEYFDFITWIDSKIQRKTYLELKEVS